MTNDLQPQQASPENVPPICVEGDGKELCTHDANSHPGCWEKGFACESPSCKVDGVDRDDLCEAEDGSLWCREHFPVPPLVFELWYDDGEVGAYEAEAEDRPMVEHLWRLFSHGADHQASHIVVRMEAASGEEPVIVDLTAIVEQFPGLKDGETEVNGGDLVAALSALIQKTHGGA